MGFGFWKSKSNLDLNKIWIESESDPGISSAQPALVQGSYSAFQEGRCTSSKPFKPSIHSKISIILNGKWWYLINLWILGVRQLRPCRPRWSTCCWCHLNKDQCFFTALSVEPCYEVLSCSWCPRWQNLWLCKFDSFQFVSQDSGGHVALG